MGPRRDHALVQLAYLVDEFFREAARAEVNDRKLVRLSAAISARSIRMGLDPFARRSLQWTLVAQE